MSRFHLLAVFLIALTASGVAAAAPRYTTDWVGSLCRPVSDELLATGLTQRAMPHRYRFDQTVHSFNENNFSYCRVMFFGGYEAPPEEIEAELQLILGRKCGEADGTIVPFNYTKPPTKRRRYPEAAQAYFCMAGEHRALFFFHHEGVELNLAEPNSPEGIFSPDYQAFMKAHGYLTDNEIRNRQVAVQQRQRNEQVAAAARAQRHVAERGLRSEVGARLCRSSGEITYVGFVESRSADNDKVQIRVAHAYLGSATRLQPGGFSPHIIWAHPDDWHLCE